MSTQYRFGMFALVMVLSLVAGSTFAQGHAFEWKPRSGDAWIDRQLDDINDYGDRYRDAFIDELVRYHATPRELAQDLLVNRRWAPGDVYYACALAQVIGRACRDVVGAWDRDHAQGWGEVAKALGIKPGSPEFHRLKRGFLPTYDRWSRPVVLDRDLQRAFPDHATPASNRNGKPSAAKPKQGKPRAQHDAAHRQGAGKKDR